MQDTYQLENIDDLATMSCPPATSEPEMRDEMLQEILRDVEEVRAMMAEMDVGDTIDREEDLLAESRRFLKPAKRHKRQRRRKMRMVAGMVGLFLFPPALVVAILP